MRTNLKKTLTSTLLAVSLAVPTMLPATAAAQSRHQKVEHRQQTKNQWRNLGIAGGAAGVLGLLTGNKTLTALGIGGGLYSAYRYEQDRKSQNKLQHNRYQLFNRTSFNHGGHRYVRKTKMVKGQKYYYFQKTR